MDNNVKGNSQLNSNVSPVLETSSNSDDIIQKHKQQHVEDRSFRCNPKLSKNGPWSLDWLAQIPDKPSISDALKNGSKGADKFTFTMCGSEHKKKLTKKFKHSMGFVKRVTRMSSADSREILKNLKKKDRKRSVYNVTKESQDASTSKSETSKKSTSSVNND